MTKKIKSKPKAKYKKYIIIASFIALNIVIIVILAYGLALLIDKNRNKNTSTVDKIVAGLSCDRFTLQFLSTDVFCSDAFYRNPVVTPELARAYLVCDEDYLNQEEKDIATTEYDTDDISTQEDPAYQERERQKDRDALKQKRATCSDEALLNKERARIAKDLNKQIGEDLVSH